MTNPFYTQIKESIYQRLNEGWGNDEHITYNGGYCLKVNRTNPNKPRFEMHYSENMPTDEQDAARHIASGKATKLGAADFSNTAMDFMKKHRELNESVKKIGEYPAKDGVHVAKVYHLTGEHDEGDPFTVKLFRNGKHYEPAQYFTNDKDDAHSTAKRMISENQQDNYEIINENRKSGAMKARWMGEFENHVTSLAPNHSGKIDWDTAHHHYFSGKEPKEAAEIYVNNRKSELSEGVSKRHPLEGHPYHTKSDESLRYIMKDAAEAREALGKDHPSNGKYSDQINDASTVLGLRQRFKKEGGMPDWYKKLYGHDIHEETTQTIRSILENRMQW